MAKGADMLRAKFGANMAESMAASTTAHAPHIMPGAGSAQEKQEGTKALRDGKLIELRKIMPDPDQPRKAFEPEELERLSSSIRDRGVLQPIRVRWSDEHRMWVIIAGERRYRAARIAGLSELPCVTVHAEQDAGELLIDQLIENCLREDLQPIEQANAFKALMDRNDWPASRLAIELNLSNSMVSRALALLKLAPELQAQVDAGELPASTAVQIARVEDPAAQVELAERSRTESVKAIKAEVASEAPRGRGRVATRITISRAYGQSTLTYAGPVGASRQEAIEAAKKFLKDLAKDPKLSDG